MPNFMGFFCSLLSVCIHCFLSNARISISSTGNDAPGQPMRMPVGMRTGLARVIVVCICDKGYFIAIGVNF